MPFANDCLDMAQTCLNEIQTVSVDQHTDNSVEFIVRDKVNGEPIDLTPYLPGSSSSTPPGSSQSSSSSFSSSSSSDAGLKTGAELLVKQMPTDPAYYLQKMLTIVDAPAGKVRLDYEGNQLLLAGAFVGAIALWQAGLRRRNIPIFFNVETTLEMCQRLGPLTIPEIRFAMRDSCPEANFLIDQVEFTNSEIHWAIRRPLDQWNETPPPVGIYSPATFPYRYYWLEAVVAELLYMAVTSGQRNDLPYSAGGVSVDDRRRWQSYLPHAQERRSRWEAWMKAKKLEINVTKGFAQVDSGVYGWNRWWT